MTDQIDMGFEEVESRTTEKESEGNSLSSIPIETDEMTTTTQVPSRDWQIGCNLNDCLLNVYTNDRWTDITIRCGDKEISRPLKAHKIILAARSPVFEAMFFGPCSESKTEYTFPNDDVEIFDKMLRFMYHDDVNLTDVDEAADLMQMAHMYQITCLVDHCALFLQNNVTLSSVCKSLDCALKYNLTSLRDACCDFVDRNADEVIRTDGFLNVSKEGLTYMLKGDTFFAGEDIIFHRVEEWAKLKLSELGKEENGQNIRDILGEAFYHLRLSTLDLETLMECIRRKGYFSTDEYEDIMDCKSGQLSLLSFLSNVRRVPLEESVTYFNSGMSSETNENSIDRTWQIIVHKNLCLRSIAIPHFKSYINYNEQLYKKMYRSYEGPLEGQYLPNSLNPELSVVVTIDKVNFKNCSNVRQCSDESSKIVFNGPVLLKRRHSPYDLKILIKPTIGDPRVMLVSTNGVVESLLSDSGTLSVSGNSSMLIIDAMEIQNCSSRQNEEVSEEEPDESTTSYFQIHENFVSTNLKRRICGDLLPYFNRIVFF